MSELTTRLREILAAFAASDPTCKRFGAAQHRYQLLPPIDHSELDRPEGRSKSAPLHLWPADYLEYVTRLSAGGVGPYYGLVPADRTAAFVITPPARTTWQRALPIAHLGCGYFAVLVLDGAAAGQVWIDARAIELVAPIYPSFTAFYLDWVDRVAHTRWLDGFAEPGQCAITAALSGYLALRERQLGIAAGTLAGSALYDALAALGPGAIEVTASQTTLFAPSDRVDPCATCARALQGLVEQGLRADAVAAGVPPLPCR